MAMESIERFQKAAQSDEGLRERMNEVLAKSKAEEYAEKLAAFANGEGYAFSAEEFRKYQMQGQEVSDDELEAVSGGKRDWLTDGCAATVEPGSWCGSNDWCYVWDVTYVHYPLEDPVCSKCGGVVYADSGYYICTACGHREKVHMDLC